jgi:hypothetical protein
MILEQTIREKFEKWADEQGHNLTRHPTNNDFYYSREVSMLWVCYAEAYAQGRMDENFTIQDMLADAFSESETISAETQAILERTTELDD